MIAASAAIGPMRAPANRASVTNPRDSTYGQLKRSIGDHAADKLVEDFGGRRLYIPRDPMPGDRLTGSIGLAAALAMARIFGGDRLPIPISFDADRRRLKIIAMRSEGATVSAIAHEMHCTERNVYRVLSKRTLPARSSRLRVVDAPAGCTRGVNRKA